MRPTRRSERAERLQRCSRENPYAQPARGSLAVGLKDNDWHNWWESDGLPWDGGRREAGVELYLALRVEFPELLAEGWNSYPEVGDPIAGPRESDDEEQFSTVNELLERAGYREAGADVGRLRHDQPAASFAQFFEGVGPNEVVVSRGVSEAIRLSGEHTPHLAARVANLVRQLWRDTELCSRT